MAEKENSKRELTDAQKLILSKVISRRNSSTFVLAINEEDEAKINEYRNILQKVQGQKLDDEQQKALDKLKDEVLEIHKNKTLCAHCKQPAKVEGDITNITYSCDCEDAKKEKADKESIEAQHAVLDKEFYDLQIAATNKAIELYKEKYKDVIEARKKAFEILDNDILNAAEL